MEARWSAVCFCGEHLAVARKRRRQTLIPGRRHSQIRRLRHTGLLRSMPFPAMAFHTALPDRFQTKSEMRGGIVISEHAMCWELRDLSFTSSEHDGHGSVMARSWPAPFSLLNGYERVCAAEVAASHGVLQMAIR